jgi:hypothetical protein
MGDAGGIRSLIEGRSDYELIQDGPQFSYFIDQFVARPQFQTQMLAFDFQGEPGFGDLYTQNIPIAGDLITRMYIRIDLPELPYNNFGARVGSYASSLGNYLIEYVELLVDRRVIERYYGEFNEMAQEISIPQNKQSILSLTTGKDTYNSSLAKSLYILMPFSACERGFPLLAIKAGAAELRIQFRKSTDFTFPPYLISDKIKGKFLFEYVYIGPKEAIYFQGHKRTYLTEQTQLFQGLVRPNVSTEKFFLNFMGPVKELYFIIQYQTITSNVFDYTYSSTVKDHLVSLSLNTGGFDLIPEDIGTALYLRVIQPMDYHTRTPTRTIFYTYSLCIDPENIEPTGHVNFGRIHNQVLTLNVVPSDQPRLVRVYARVFNIFTTENGTGKLLFNTSDG